MNQKITHDEMEVLKKAVAIIKKHKGIFDLEFMVKDSLGNRFYDLDLGELPWFIKRPIEKMAGMRGLTVSDYELLLVKANGSQVIKIQCDGTDENGNRCSKAKYIHASPKDKGLMRQTMDLVRNGWCCEEHS